MRHMLFLLTILIGLVSCEQHSGTGETWRAKNLDKNVIVILSDTKSGVEVGDTVYVSGGYKCVLLNKVEAFGKIDTLDPITKAPVLPLSSSGKYTGNEWKLQHINIDDRGLISISFIEDGKEYGLDYLTPAEFKKETGVEISFNK